MANTSKKKKMFYSYKNVLNSFLRLIFRATYSYILQSHQIYRYMLFIWSENVTKLTFRILFSICKSLGVLQPKKYHINT